MIYGSRSIEAFFDHFLLKSLSPMAAKKNFSEKKGFYQISYYII